MAQPLDVIKPNKIDSSEARLNNNEWVLEATDNNGVVTTFPDDKLSKPNYLDCIVYAKTKATTDFHMIIIKKDGQDFQRWDRDRVLYSNKWKEVEDLDEIKIIGKVNQFYMVNFG